MVASILDYSGLVVPSGPHIGEPLEVLAWQKKFAKAALSPKVRVIALSLARGNGKTGFTGAFSYCLFEQVLGAGEEIIAVAPTLKQSKIIFKDMLAQKPRAYFDKTLYRKNQSNAGCLLECLQTSKAIQCLPALEKSLHGQRGSIYLLDEPAQFEANQRDAILEVIKTGMGKQKNVKLICLGTSSPDKAHWFSQMLEGKGCNKVFYFKAKNQGLTWENVKLANPSINHKHFKVLKKTIKQELEEAKENPHLAHAFKKLRLNLPIERNKENAILSLHNWKAVEDSSKKGSGSFVLGIDLGGSQALTAAAAYFENDHLETMGFFPHSPDLLTRGKSDFVGDLYKRCFDLGEIQFAGENLVDIPQMLEWVLSNWGNPAAIVCDRWREAELREALAKISFPLAKLINRGQGFKDQAADLREFRKIAIQKKFTVSPSQFVRYAFSEAVAVADPAGNEKLAKNSEGGRRSKARDDLVAAIILAVAHHSHAERPSFKFRVV